MHKDTHTHTHTHTHTFTHTHPITHTHTSARARAYTHSLPLSFAHIQTHTEHCQNSTTSHAHTTLTSAANTHWGKKREYYSAGQQAYLHAAHSYRHKLYARSTKTRGFSSHFLMVGVCSCSKKGWSGCGEAAARKLAQVSMSVYVCVYHYV